MNKQVYFRSVKESDRTTLDAWIANDSDHFGKVTADFWIVPNACAVEDKDGIVLYVRTDPEPPNTVRLHMQFEEDSEYRTGKTLFRGFPHFARELWEAGCRRLVFETVNPKLSGFCQRLWGFRKVEDTNDWELFLKSKEDQLSESLVAEAERAEQ